MTNLQVTWILIFSGNRQHLETALLIGWNPIGSLGFAMPSVWFAGTLLQRFSDPTMKNRGTVLLQRSLSTRKVHP